MVGKHACPSPHCHVLETAYVCMSLCLCEFPGKYALIQIYGICSWKKYLSGVRATGRGRGRS